MEIRRLAKFALVIICLSTTIVKGQFTNNDFTILTKGISEEYVTRFKENKPALVNIFNELNITRDITPIIIKVSFENGEVMVIAEINFDFDRVFSKNSDYAIHNNILNPGKGVSVLLQSEIFDALHAYIQSVSIKGLTIFDSMIKMKKSNGDWINFYAFNNYNFNGSPYTFYNNVNMNVGGKVYETKAKSSEALNKYHYFSLGMTKGLDGIKTGAYYFCKFFKIDTE